MLIKATRIGSRLAHRLEQTTNHLQSARANMATLGGHSKKHKVTVVGSGNWSVFYVLHVIFLLMSQGLNDCKDCC